MTIRLSDPDGSGLSRRRVLLSSLALAGGAVAGLPAATASAAPRNGTAASTANGWPVLPSAVTTLVEGSDLTVSLCPGPATVILVHCLRRYLYEVDATVRQDELTGYRADRVASTAEAGNHRSGTAIAVRPAAYPDGVAGGYFPPGVAVIRDIVAECEGVVRWGADCVPVQESRFQIDVPPSDPALLRVADKITAWAGRPGEGAGVVVDPAEPGRRAAAIALQRQQRR
ncbi:hypothetical protein VA596_23865 [Amycolatopsis sp., V23-08]|uniref:Tat pathway signal sequence domain protein n=1 Tax=Amycolatopsis heterodermiae TaxID=3110235 RepID=A0ABU5R8Q2_9PSEU|nr:hypothetical protein [Amycolatopsis sp., V23-08]MEA5362593.1 hypothetical protein [Amycolatopsis sp., V23-08]